MTENVNGKRLLNIAETARYLSISPGTLYNRSCRKTKNPFPVRAKRVGGSVRFDRLELDRYIDSL